MAVESPRSLDDIDKQLLDLLVADARSTVRALANQVGLSEPAVHERLRRLERESVIVRYSAVINPNTVNASNVAFVAVRLAPGSVDFDKLTAAFRREANILESHVIAGDDCYLLKVRAASNGDLANLVKRLKAVPGVQSTRTTIVLETAFERPLSVNGALSDTKN